MKPVIPPELGEYKGYKLYSASTLHHLPFGDCFDYCRLSIAVLRSNGVPAVLDYLPQWGRGFLSHSWFAFLNDNGAFLCSPWGIDSNPGDIFHPWAPIPKIFRYTYSRNPRMEKYMQSAGSTDGTFSLFQKDVTDQYLLTSDPEIPLFPIPYDSKWIYIAAFNNSGWNIVDFGKRHGRKGHFQEMGRRMAYMTFGLSDGRLVPASDPFIIENDGTIRFMKADTSSVRQV